VWVLRIASIVAFGPLLLVACSGASAAASPGATEIAVVSPSPSAPSAALSAPSPSPSAPATSPSPTGAFHLVKSCTGYVCTVTASNYQAIPAGARISYSGSGNDALVAVIKVAGGTATGQCNIATLPGKCTFASGTGSLAKFHEDLVVTQDASGLWIWDGPLAP
jgi:hypothetical protein